MKLALNFRKITYWGSALLMVMPLLAVQSVEAQELDGTLKRIRTTSTLNIGYLQFAPPFSLLGPDKIPAGYSIDLCKQIANAIQKQLSVNLKINWVEVTPENRMSMVEQGKVDIECGTSTATLSRRERVDFSLMTFVDGGSFLTLAKSPVRTLADLSKRRIAVISGTTTEKALARFLKEEGITAVTVPVKDHTEGRTALENGTVQALASDQGILIGLAVTTSDPSRFALSDHLFSYEPYAFMLRRNEPAFRLAVDRALSAMYRSGEILTIYDRWFGVLVKPSDAMKAMYLLTAQPD